MRFEIGRVDHHCLWCGGFGGQSVHHSGEDAHVTPPLPTVVEGLCRPVFLRRVTPAQAIAIDEYNPAQNTPVIDLIPKFPPALRGVLGVKYLALGRHLVHCLFLQKFHRGEVAQC